MRARTVLLPGLVALFAATGLAASFGVISQTDWNEGSFSGTTTKGDALVVDGSGSGTYTSKIFDGGDNYTWDGATITSSLNGGSATLTVETSRDEFGSTQDLHTVGLSSNTSYSLSLDKARYVRFNYSLSGDAWINSTNITFSDDSSFFIRNGSCQSDETELFSMSNTTNAHASGPGHWSRAVCASGFNQQHFTQVCASDETAVLSFFGDALNTSHLSTDEALFNNKLCTEALTVGVRDQCPTSTKAIVSLYQTSEDHIAEPGHYSNQLCGAFFDSVTAMLRFHLGKETVHVNETVAQEGVFRDLAGRETWHISAQNETLLAGIVSGEDTSTTSVGYVEDGVDTVLNMTQERGKSSYFLPFTTGTAGDLADRTSLIASGSFLDELNPNFAFALAEEMTVRLTLSLANMDLISDYDLAAGAHQLLIQNLGETSGGNAKVSVNVTR